MLAYTTGDPTGATDPDDGEAFAGLLPLDQVPVVQPRKFFE